MTNEHENIDRLIREALSDENARAFDDLGEQSLVEQAFGALSGRGRALKILMMFIALIMFGLAVYSAVSFFRAADVKELLMWASGFFFFMMATTGIKVWWWMEMEKNATVREIKRVELQVAQLAGLLESMKRSG
jgi:hypothetical protein